MVNRSEPQRLIHAHVECRSQGAAWWRYARPALPPEPRLIRLLLGASGDESDAIGPLGLPWDASDEVRDEYTWPVEENWSRDVPHAVTADVADEWLRSGRSEIWPTREPCRRVTDPAFERPAHLDAQTLRRVLDAYERESDQLIPASCCALLAMMNQLERDFEVRVLLWSELVLPHVPEESLLDLRQRLASAPRARTTIMSEARSRDHEVSR